MVWHGIVFHLVLLHGITLLCTVVTAPANYRVVHLVILNTVLENMTIMVIMVIGVPRVSRGHQGHQSHHWRYSCDPMQRKNYIERHECSKSQKVAACWIYTSTSSLSYVESSCQSQQSKC